MRALPFALCASCLLTAGAAENPKGTPLKVGVIQFRSSNDVADNARRMAEHLIRLAGQGVQVAVFPEYCLVPYDAAIVQSVPAAGVISAEESLRAVCRDRKIAAIFGSVYKVNGRIYNTAVVYDSHGELVERYGKIHLAGERFCTPGNHISYFELEGVPSTVMICHDERYPELARLPAIQGARVLYYISHESGMNQESKLVPYRAQIQARAVENQIYVVHSNAPALMTDPASCHGQSRIIKEDGNILQEASIFGEETMVESLLIKPAKLERPLKELMGEWWQAGVADMMKNRRRPLD